MVVSVRSASVSDAEILSVLALAVWVDTYVPRGVSASFARHLCEDYGPACFVGYLAQPRGRILIAEVDGLAVGFLRLDLDSQCPADATMRAEIATLYVLPAQHGRGAGSALLAAACRLLAALQIGHAWLTVNAENDRAIAFYSRREWRRMGTFDFAIDGGRYLNLVFKSPRLLPEGATT